MTDMAATIVPKSDQLNADDLIAGPRTITIREVQIAPGTEQPVAVYFQGDDGKPFRPCKSMRRVMVALWGPDASAYAGRSMTLYRDPRVKWGGMEVGGIRISHMSHIDKQTVIVLTETQKARKPFTVAPLVEQKQPPQPAKETPEQAAERARVSLLGSILNAATEDALHELRGKVETQKMLDWLRSKFPQIEQEIASAFAKRFNDFITPEAAQ